MDGQPPAVTGNGRGAGGAGGSTGNGVGTRALRPRSHTIRPVWDCSTLGVPDGAGSVRHAVVCTDLAVPILDVTWGLLIDPTVRAAWDASRDRPADGAAALSAPEGHRGIQA